MWSRVEGRHSRQGASSCNDLGVPEGYLHMDVAACAVFIAVAYNLVGARGMANANRS